MTIILDTNGKAVPWWRIKPIEPSNKQDNKKHSEGYERERKRNKRHNGRYV